MAELAAVTDAEIRAEIAKENTTRRHATALLEALGLDYGEDDEDGRETMCVDQDELDQAIRFIADAEARGRASVPTVASAELEASLAALAPNAKELEADVRLVRQRIGGGPGGTRRIEAGQALSRIAAALGVKL
jgi:hypothetical protein